eukprot:TRINITY_DN5223_c0_g1_i1.p1 TRINITY_DN5223_c0_g1~~TRINITY_DN5223_c0_g1_i1.p1  ORF type:complete len:636 (-),score=169.56 TRINITY_DN5223_c0_g1_i1:47-1954(-)
MERMSSYSDKSSESESSEQSFSEITTRVDLARSWNIKAPHQTDGGTVGSLPTSQPEQRPRFATGRSSAPLKDPYDAKRGAVDEDNLGTDFRMSLKITPQSSNDQTSEKQGKSHQLVKRHFTSPTYCQHCGGFIWGLGKQGYACTECKYCVHVKCKEVIAHFKKNHCGDRLREPTREEEELQERLKTEHERLESLSAEEIEAIKVNGQPEMEHIHEEDESISPRKIQRKFTIIRESDGNQFRRRHQWAVINSKTSTKCHLCQQTVGTLGKKCCTCGIKVHTSCLKEDSTLETDHYCKPLHENLLLVPPFSPTSASHTPVAVFINPRSGGQQGNRLFHLFNRLLGPEQVFDLSDGGPAKGLEKFKDVENARFLVAGGDGSVGWVLSIMDKLGITDPPVAILPLGTGNDLARCLKWGPGYQGEEIPPILRQIEIAHPVKLDRWTLTISTEERTETKVMNNYFSLGSDAAVALGFHNKRESSPEMFTSRLVNQMWYGYFGVKSTMSSSDLPVNQAIELEVDGVPIKMSTHLFGIIILNLNSYAGGVPLWNVTKERKDAHFVQPSFSDGLLEIVGIKGALDMGVIKSGTKKPPKVAQGRSIKISCKVGMPLQVDGEPWRSEPCTITITHLNQANMLLAQS